MGFDLTERQVAILARAERVGRVHPEERELGLVRRLLISARLRVDSNGERQHERHPLLRVVVVRDPALVTHLIGRIDTDIVGREERLLIGEHDVVLSHKVVARG